MLTKDEIVDLVIEGKAGGISPDYKKFHPVVIRKALDLALTQLIALDMKEQMREEGTSFIESTWVKTFQGKQAPKIKIDNDRVQCYVELPARLVGLTNNRGLREVSWPQGGNLPFHIINDQAYASLSNLECSVHLDGVYYAQIEGDRIYFPDMNTSLKGKKVVVKMVAASDGYANDEVLPIPDSKSTDLFFLLSKMLDEQKGSKQKMTNDSNPNTF